MKKFTKTKKIKNTRIILTDESKKKLTETMNKYHVSLSTIAQILVIACYTSIKQEEKQTILETYIFKNGKETYIKPKLYDEITERLDQKTKLISNLLYLYTTKNLKNYINNIEKVQNKINKELQNKKETYWNLNETIRTQKRALRMLGAITN